MRLSTLILFGTLAVATAGCVQSNGYGQPGMLQTQGGRAVAAFPQVPQPPLAPGHENPIEHGLVREEIRGSLLDDPADVGLRVAAPKRRERGQRVDHVPDGAELDDQDVHPLRSLMIHCTASSTSSAMKAGMSVRTIFDP